MPVVPPGHHVVVVKPTGKPGLSRLASGPWVLDFGDAGAATSVIAGLSKFLTTTTEPGTIVWLMTSDVCRMLTLSEAALSAASAVVSAAGNASHLMVFPDDCPERTRLMVHFRQLGCGAHLGGPERECFVEVHKPDGSIVVGLAGRAIDPSDEADAAARGPLSSTPLSDLITLLRREDSTPDDWSRFASELMASRLGVVASGVPEGGQPGTSFQAARGQVSLELVAGPNGRAMVKACADPIAFRRRFPETRITAELLGRDLLGMILKGGSAEGVLVCSATSLHSAPIDRATAERLLGS